MSRYAQTHVNPKGPGDGRPTALQIVEDEGLIGKLHDKVFVVTGVSSGIGIKTMRALYATGGHVMGTVRNVPKGQRVVEEVTATTKGGRITLIEMDLESLASVKKGAESILQQTDKINVLVANAGVMATPEGKTKDGFETQFGTNYVSHFYLFQLLKDRLLQSGTPDFPSRFVSVASTGHRAGSLANEVERRYGSSRLHATSLYPGGIATANLTPEVLAYIKSPEQGAATSVYAAEQEERLWEESLTIVGLSDNKE
ncbi:hypothetical protein CERZMDRAFT_113588 [Cercospora zeae-maydis SCOH1-5]|uniref:Ketoreductase (KR) domain-containing protein n=1 Tax=Cercospora zeae-maydis SCOH1-5 TaxID=717836 RepID=A0A6A6F8V9_9PEZI|nr:hypothetical protein CERZMDRAFT_113588 [Cercospora zeae-maydis SCOH1-5]